MLGMEDTHKRSHIAVIIMASVVFTLTAILTFISHGPLAAARKDIFTNNTVEIFNSYHTSLTPADWTYFASWILIFAWLLAAFGYSFSTLYRFTSYGYLYIAPGHVKWTMYALLSFAMVLQVAWLFVVDTENLAWACVLSAMTTATLLVTLVHALKKMFSRGLILQREEATKEIWLCRIILHNALDWYATWFFYLTLLNFNTVLIYGFDVTDYLSGVGTAGFLLIVIVGAFCVDIFALDRYTRYCITGYVAFILGLTGTVVNNWNISSSVTILSTLTLVTTAIAFGLKLAVSTIRHKREPIWTSSTMFLPNRSYGAMDERHKNSPNLTYSSDIF